MWFFTKGGRSVDDVRAIKDEASRHLRAGQYAQAARLFARLVRLEPRDIQHAVRLGDAHRLRGRPLAALEAYRSAMERYARSGELPKAQAVCRLMRQMLPDDPELQALHESLSGQRHAASRPRPAPVPEPREAVPPPEETTFRRRSPHVAYDLGADDDAAPPGFYSGVPLADECVAAPGATFAAPDDTSAAPRHSSSDTRV